MRERNYSIGQQAESRICTLLKELGATEIIQGNHNAIPDVEFRFGKTKFYAELKTVLTPHAQNRNGVAKMTLTEFDAMQNLWSDHVKLLIVDIRAHSGPGHAYFVVPWKAVQVLFESTAAMKSLTFWWILENGTRLDQWRPAK